MFASEKNHKERIDVLFQDHLMLCKMDLEGRITEVNDRFCDVTQYQREELIGKHSRILQSGYHPRSFFKELWEKILSGQMWHGDIKNKKKFGSLYWARTTIIPVCNPQGVITHFIDIKIDITEEKEKEQKIQFDATILQEIVGLVKVGGWIYFPQSQELYWSRETYQLHEVPVDEKITIERALSFYTEESLPVIQSAIEKGIQDLHGWNLELPMRTDKGRFFWAHTIGKVEVRDSQVYRVFGTFQDISERKELDQKLFQKQKLESLGVLAGGIAHDFNNLLTGIIGNVELMREDLPAEHQVSSSLEMIEQASYRAAELCSQMLAYAGKGRFEKSSCSLNDLIQRTLSLVQHSLDKRINVHLDLDHSLPNVFVDSIQIQQIIMNLVINAGDAMEGKSGEISIQTRSVLGESMENDQEGVGHQPEGSYVHFKISDTGCGMSEETLKRIYEPFFSTKFTGRGLGLSAVLGIIKGHDGFLKVYSKPGEGTAFDVYLPSVKGESLATRNTRRFEPWMGEGTVLLVEDERFIREIASRRLKNLGFEVLEAEDGLAGWELYLRFKDQIRFVITDLTMPKMNGVEFLGKLREIDSTIPCIVMSAYSLEEIGKYSNLNSQVYYLKKPANGEQFSKCTRQCYEESLKKDN